MPKREYVFLQDIVHYTTIQEMIPDFESNNYSQDLIRDIIQAKIRQFELKYNYANERVAKLIAAKYISTLSDREFLDLQRSEGLISDEQYESLTRKYKDIKDLENEASLHKAWKHIEKEQTPLEK